MYAQRRLPSVRRAGSDLTSTLRLCVGPAPAVERASRIVSRNELLAGLVLLGFVNGISERVTLSIPVDGFVGAVLLSFDISVLVWAACAIGVAFVLRGPLQPANRSDMAVAVCAAAACLAPIPQLSWLALSAVAIHIVRGSERASLLHRGGWIVLAMTVPMFWGRLIFAALSDFLLAGDAVLIAAVIGTPRVGNAVKFADGSGYLWIAPPCSSLTNVSLVILCWVICTKVTDHIGSLRDAGWILVACAGVVAINVARISLIGLYPGHFELIHGPIGATVANWLIFGVTVGICLLGVRHDLQKRD
jgi:hypothetical protein